MTIKAHTIRGALNNLQNSSQLSNQQKIDLNCKANVVKIVSVLNFIL